MRTLTALALLVLFTLPAAAQQSDIDRQQALRHLRFGQELLRDERWDKAEAEFRAAIKLDPLLELAHYGVGQAAMATKRYPDAVRAYLNCRDAFRANSAEALSNSAVAEQRLQDQIRELQDAVLAFTRGRARTLNTTATVTRLNTQIRELESRRHRSTSGPPPTPPWISIALGSAYFRTGAMGDAEREYLEAVRVDPRLGEGHNNLAVLYMLTGRLDEAERAVRAAEQAGFSVNPQFKEDLKKARN